jgi:hypothetical protein
MRVRVSKRGQTWYRIFVHDLFDHGAWNRGSSQCRRWRNADQVTENTIVGRQRDSPSAPQMATSAGMQCHVEERVHKL